MNKLTYNIVGWILILATAVAMFGAIYFNVGDTYDFFMSIFWAIVIFVLGFFSGKFYIRIKEENVLTKSASILTIIGMVLVVIGLVFGFQRCVGSCDPIEFALPLLFGAVVGGILYGVSLILLVINWIRSR